MISLQVSWQQISRCWRRRWLASFKNLKPFENDAKIRLLNLL